MKVSFSNLSIFRVARTPILPLVFFAKNRLLSEGFGLPLSPQIALIPGINPQQSATGNTRFLTVETVEHKATRCPVHGVFVFLPEVPFVGEGWRRCSVCGWREEGSAC